MCLEISQKLTAFPQIPAGWLLDRKSIAIKLQYKTPSFRKMKRTLRIVTRVPEIAHRLLSGTGRYNEGRVAALTGYVQLRMHAGLVCIHFFG